MSNYIMEGDRSLWRLAGMEWKNGEASPFFVRAGFQRGERADDFTELRAKVADTLDDFHPLDHKAIRILYRAYKRFDEIAFGPKHEREIAWITGCFITAIFCVIAIMMKLRGLP